MVPVKAGLPQNWGDHHHEADQVYGTIESFPDQLFGDWIVDGISYTADSQTLFGEEHGPFAIGACVEVIYLHNDQGEGYQALKIQTEYAYKCESSQEPLSETSGLVVSFPENLVGTWVVDTTSYTAKVNTSFEQEHGPFFVGGCVEVKYVTETHEAIEIETKDTEECGGESEEHIYGLINEVPEGYTQTVNEHLSITGTWVINGIEFISTPETELKTEYGPLVVGACAKVEYRMLNG